MCLCVCAEWRQEKLCQRARSSIYQDPVFLVFGQDNGRYSTNDSLRGTRSSVRQISHERQIQYYHSNVAI